MSSAQFHPALTAAAQAVATDNRPAIQQHIEKFLLEHPDHADGLLLRAWTANSLDIAYHCIQRVLELDPENATANSAMNWMQGIWTLAHEQIEIDQLEQTRLQKERVEEEGAQQNLEVTETKGMSLRLFESADSSSAKPVEEASSDNRLDRNTFSDDTPTSQNQEHRNVELQWNQISETASPRVENDASGTAAETVGGEALEEESQLQHLVTSLSQEIKDEVDLGQKARKLIQFLETDSENTEMTHSDRDETLSKKPLILVVDDSSTIRKLVSITLSEKGYDVVMAPDGVEGIKLVAERLPDLILLDINMPRLSGFKLCSFFKKHQRTANIPVIMLSGNDGLIDKLRSKIKGCDAFIRKPFAASELVATVGRHLPCATS